MRNLRSDPTQRRDHYQELTDRIIGALEAGFAPWRRPWDPNSAADRRCRSTLRPVIAIAASISSCSACRPSPSSGDPRWCSYRQAAARGWQVRKGEKATPVYFYKPIEIEDKADGRGGETRAFRCCGRSRSFMLRK